MHSISDVLNVRYRGRREAQRLVLHGALYAGLNGITTHHLEALRADYWIENEQCRKTVTSIYSVFWDVKSVRGCGMPLRFVPAISADKLLASGMHPESRPRVGRNSERRGLHWYTLTLYHMMQQTRSALPASGT